MCNNSVPVECSSELQRFARLLQDGFVEARSVQIIRPDGSQRTVDVTGSVVELSDRSVILSIARDVTEEHRLSEEIRQYQRMESIAQLTQGVAHDFNNI